jgi:hypothetical protein
MIYDVEFAEDIYDDTYVELSVDEDDMDAAEAGFMHGYLGRWRSF